MSHINKLIIVLMVCVSSLAGAQQVNWTTIEKASQTSSDKIYMIDFYTDWCGYCKKMDRETFSNPVVAKILNRYYTPVKFNAEGNATFTWGERKYVPTPTPKGSRPAVHMFAKAVLGQKIGFPTFAFFAPDQSLLTLVQGYNNANDFAMILWYFASGDNKKYSFDHYTGFIIFVF